MKSMNQYKRMSKHIKYLLAALFMCVNTAVVASVFEADNFYRQQNFEQARLLYLSAAEVGSPHAYYQLGTIYFKGQGTPANITSALIWFSLAAEYQYNDSGNIVRQLIENIPAEKRINVDALVSAFKKKYGKQQIEKKYLPEIITANLNEKVTFGDDSKLDNTDDVLDEINDEFFNTEDDFIFEDDDEEQELGTADSFTSSSSSLLNLPIFAVIDHDVAADGSIRNITKLHTIGRQANINSRIYELSINDQPKPSFKGQPTHFINRRYIGLAKYSRARLRNNHGELYGSVRRTVKKLLKNERPDDKYKYAMMMLYFPWLEQHEGETLALLQTLSKEGHVNAQYEYGLYLYREQIDPAQAIKWLSLASQSGLAKAEYQLAKITQDSPWVVQDDKKSLFWFESAAQKGHAGARLKAAEIKLLSQNEALLDHLGAIAYLQQIEATENNNPEYHYLVAISHRKGESRNIPEAVSALRLAIAKGERLNWDVSYWEYLLSRWTTGNVYLKEL
ncbi:MAG: tetratricopeptide repeat protein [Glaciecola sp.]